MKKYSVWHLVSAWGIGWACQAAFEAAVVGKWGYVAIQVAFALFNLGLIIWL